MAAIAAVIGSNLKLPGRVTFQAQGQGAGPISLLVVDCEQANDQLLLRGMARSQSKVAPAPLHELLGEGNLLFSLQTANSNMPYQSYVPLEGNSIAQIFERFMTQSAQQPARLWLFADARQASCLFLQTLPPREHAEAVDPDGWNRVQQLAATVKRQELQLPVTTFCADSCALPLPARRGQGAQHAAVAGASGSCGNPRRTWRNRHPRRHLQSRISLRCGNHRGIVSFGGTNLALSSA
jgi:hypothetical protein